MPLTLGNGTVQFGDGTTQQTSAVPLTGGTMTGPLIAPTHQSTYTPPPQGFADARCTGFQIATGKDIGWSVRTTIYFSDLINNCSSGSSPSTSTAVPAGYIPTGNCFSNPRYFPPNTSWWTWGLPLTYYNPGFDFAGGRQVTNQPVGTPGYIYSSYYELYNEIAGSEQHRNYAVCNCGNFNCFNNCNCNCACNC